MSNTDQYDYFNFYTRYKWTKDDFENFEQNFLYTLKALARKNPSSLLRGYDFNSAVGFSLSVNSGLAIDVNGFPLHKSSTITGISVGAPSVSQLRWSLVVARKITTDINPITDPNNPSNTVYLNTREECSVVCIDGTLGSSAYPTKLAGDVILFGLKLPANASSILSTYVDYTIADYPNKNNDSKMFEKFDAVVGSSKLCTHRDINSVMADSNIANIKEILIKDSDTIDTVQTINQPNKRITFKAGVTLIKGAASTGFLIQASGIDVIYGRFQDFSSGPDKAIVYQSGADYGNVIGSRFKNCTINVQDDTVNGINVLATHTEA